MTTSGSTLFGFGSSVTNPTANSQSQAPLFGTGSESLISTQPSSSSGITPFTFGTSLFSSSTSATNLFGSSSSFGLSPSTWFSFGAPPTSTAATNTSPMVFGSSTGASSGPVFSFGSAAPTTSSLSPHSQLQPVFNAGSTNNDQMSMEDSMDVDHPVQASTPGFCQQPVFSSSDGFMLGSTAPSPANPFQFGGQAAPQNPSSLPFQASGSLEFSSGGSLSWGSGGSDKSSRRTVRVSKIRKRKKCKGKK